MERLSSKQGELYIRINEIIASLVSVEIDRVKAGRSVVAIPGLTIAHCRRINQIHAKAVLMLNDLLTIKTEKDYEILLSWVGLLDQANFKDTPELLANYYPPTNPQAEDSPLAIANKWKPFP